MFLDNLKNLIVSLVPTSPALYLALENPSFGKTITTIILPIVFFIIGKTADLCVQIYFRRQEAKRLKQENLLQSKTHEGEEKK